MPAKGRHPACKGRRLNSPTTQGVIHLKGFRDFITRGNLIELAIAVVIGTAFTAVVTAIVADLITPLIGAIWGIRVRSSPTDLQRARQHLFVRLAHQRGLTRS